MALCVWLMARMSLFTPSSSPSHMCEKQTFELEGRAISFLSVDPVDPRFEGYALSGSMFDASHRSVTSWNRQMVFKSSLE